MKRAEKLYLCGSEKASAGPRVPGGPSCSCPSLGEAKGQRAVVGSRAKANQQLSKRSRSRSGRTLLYARDVVIANVPGPRCGYRQSLAETSAATRRKGHASNTMCVCLPI